MTIISKRGRPLAAALTGLLALGTLMAAPVVEAQAAPIGGGHGQLGFGHGSGGFAGGGFRGGFGGGWHGGGWRGAGWGPGWHGGGYRYGGWDGGYGGWGGWYDPAPWAGAAAVGLIGGALAASAAPAISGGHCWIEHRHIRLHNGHVVTRHLRVCD